MGVQQEEGNWTPMLSTSTKTPKCAHCAGLSFEIEHIPTFMREVIRDELRIFAAEHLMGFRAEMRDFIDQAQLQLDSSCDLQSWQGRGYAQRHSTSRPSSASCAPLQRPLPLPALVDQLPQSSILKAESLPVSLPVLRDAAESRDRPHVRGVRSSENSHLTRTPGTVQHVECAEPAAIKPLPNERPAPGGFRDDILSKGISKDSHTIDKHVSDDGFEVCDVGRRVTITSTRQDSTAPDTRQIRESKRVSIISRESRGSLSAWSASSESESSDSTTDAPRQIQSKRSQARHVASNRHKIDLSRRNSIGMSTAGNYKRSALWLVSHQVFDYAVASLIILNGLVVGMQIDWNARHTTDEAPWVYQVIEVVFCVVFTAELCLRLFAFRCKFFINRSKWWNMFDFFVVAAQIFELFMEAIGSAWNWNLNLLRILRLVRIIRLARALRLIGELRTIVSSIAGSFRPLFWTCILLFMVLYVLAVYFTQVVVNTQITLLNEGLPLPGDLEKYWGALVPSIFSLYCSITGGLDWEMAVRPLMDHVGSEMGVLYVLYITFTVFAMLNVVTGVFIESVMKHANRENEIRTMANVQHLFKHLDVDSRGEITWEKFEQSLHKNEMREFFKTIDVDIRHAKNLFEVLDVDGSGSINAAEFMDGCLRIWSPTKGLDLDRKSVV